MYASFDRKNCSYEKDTTISIYHEDNLSLMKKLKDESIQLIYCDIPYNSGKKFNDYDDALFKSKDEAVVWYRERFIEMKRLLTENGSIYIHCNWRLNSRIQLLMDEIFGESCYMSTIVRQFADKRNFPFKYDSQYDVIHYYVKNPDNYIFNTPKKGIKIVGLFENGNNSSTNEKIMLNGKEYSLPDDKIWIVNSNTLKRLIDNGEVAIYDGLPYRITRDETFGNLWCSPAMYDQYSRTKISEAYDTPKPEAVLEKIITISSNPGDVVADFFLGGGTSAVVSAKLERNFIGCDINEKSCKVTVDKLLKLNILK